MKKNSRAGGALELLQAGGGPLSESKPEKAGLHLSFDSSSKVSIDSVLALTSVIAEEMLLDLAD